jgi:NAD(P)-dependent dehydrogenase (short-subunit alcohol dehydrogenase family)
MSKFGMSMCVLGMSEELKAKGIAVNALWPRAMIRLVFWYSRFVITWWPKNLVSKIL